MQWLIGMFVEQANDKICFIEMFSLINSNTCELITSDMRLENKRENLSSHINMRTHAGTTFDSPVTLTFQLQINARQRPGVHCMFIVYQLWC